MKKIYYAVALLLIVLSAFWLQAEPQLWSYDNFFQYRSALVQYSGMLALALMTLTMILALRLAFVERLTQGLDKSYRLHKWLGIAALVTGICHWLLSIIPRYLVSWEILSRPSRSHGPRNPDSFYAVIQPLRHTAEDIGEWAFYAFVILAAIALISAIRYNKFKLSHRLMSLCYLAIAMHSLILIKHSYWPYPITYICIGLAVLGSLAALWSLLGLIGKSRQHQARISDLKFSPDNQVLELQLAAPTWQGHQSGQFAFLGFAGEPPHPFTIASTNNKSGQLRFLIKELGDFTSTLKDRIKVGDKLRVEGPYGYLAFKDPAPQLWIAGGIGIAAFEAILEERQSSKDSPDAILYYCTSAPNQALIDNLIEQAQRARVDLRIINRCKQQTTLPARLSVAQLQTEVGDLFERKTWFCGPSAFSGDLRRDFAAIHYPLKHFHEELFEMR
ncbi:ferredoxin reductase family protein [Agarivorans sp. QJM3NY_25]|uniref:ferredoxin reductase family protein n=1 Tax=Agarivorans sp. QJM3NY_25 TaxID=3421430 RepID=UPI003D7CDA60